MREIISLHIGQAGLQMASACWELFCLEHDIQMDGTIPSTKVLEGLNSNPECLFSYSSQGKYVPRAILVDDDPLTINAIKSSPLRGVFNNSLILQSKEQGGGLYARAYYQMIRDEFEQIIDSKVRKQLEACDGIQGITIYHGLNGGVGCGLTSKFLKQFKDDLSKVTKLTISVLPSKSQCNIVEPYNEVLCLDQLQQLSDLSILIDNSALNKVCYQQLDVDYPTFSTLNRMIAQMVASITQSSRFQGTRFKDLMEMRMNLLPVPQNHFVHASYGPFINIDKQNTEQVNLKNVTNSLFDQNNSFINYEQDSIKYIANSLFYRGDCPMVDIRQSIESLKQNPNIKFTAVDPQNFDLAISDKSPAQFPNSEFARTNKSVCVVSNSTGIRHTLNQIRNEFSSMYSKRAFVHWFVGEGMEEGQLSESQEAFAAKIKEIEELEAQQEEEKQEQQQEQQEQQQEQQEQQEQQ